MDGRPAQYGEVGTGQPVVFLHGWGLGVHTYQPALERLAARGCRVLAPALPGFGRTGDLVPTRLGFGEFARWLAGFLDATGVEEPVPVVGHSFGGGVGAQLAHDHPDRVASLVLVDSLGGPVPGRGRGAAAPRTLWGWLWSVPSDVLHPSRLSRALPALLADFLPNVARHPLGLWRTSKVVRSADLTGVLAELAASRLPVVVLWAKDDRVIPRASFDALCAALGCQGQVVAGSHSWLLADPDAFAAAMATALRLAGPASTGPAQVEGSLGPAMRTSPRRRVTPLASR